MGTRHHAEPVMPSSTARRSRALQVLALVVLGGLWLMHGVSATTEAGCHGVPVLMSRAGPAVDPGSPAAAGMTSRGSEAGREASAMVSSFAVEDEPADACCGENCLSGQPPSPSHFLLILLASLALAPGLYAVARPPGCPLAGPGESRRRGPPGTVGRTLLLTVCVSRT